MSRFVLSLLLCAFVWACEHPAPSALDAPPVEEEPADAVPVLEADRWQQGGVEVFHVPRAGSGIVKVRFTMRGAGSMDDPSEGLAQITAQAALRGVGDMDEEAFSAALGALGGRLDYEMEEGFVTFEGEVLARNLLPFVELVKVAMAHPRLDAEAVEGARRLRLGRMESDLEDDGLTVERFFMRFVYRGFPLGRSLDGRRSRLEAATPETVRAYHAAHYRRERLVLGFGGDVTRDVLEPLVALVLEGWPSEGVAAPAAEGRIEEAEGAWLLVDKQRRTQNHILMGHPLVPPSHEDYVALRLAGVVLGEGWRSRLSALRSEAGMSYSVTSGVWRAPNQSTLVMSTFAPPHEALRMIDAMQGVYASLLEEPVSEVELERARQLLRGMFVKEVDDVSGRLQESMRAWLYGMPRGWLEQLEAVDVEAVRGAVREHFRVSRLRVVMLCTAQHFEARVRTRAGVQSVEVATYDKDGL